MDKLAKYVGDTIAELKQVSWPTQKQSTIYTAIVIGVCFLVAMFVGAFDFLFSEGIKVLIERF